MNWADSVRTTALAALAERTVPASAVTVDRPWLWNPHDVWLSRVKRPRAVTVETPPTDSAQRARK